MKGISTLFVLTIMEKTPCFATPGVSCKCQPTMSVLFCPKEKNAVVVCTCVFVRMKAKGGMRIRGTWGVE